MGYMDPFEQKILNLRYRFSEIKTPSMTYKTVSKLIPRRTVKGEEIKGTHITAVRAQVLIHDALFNFQKLFHNRSDFTIDEYIQSIAYTGEEANRTEDFPL